MFGSDFRESVYHERNASATIESSLDFAKLIRKNGEQFYLTIVCLKDEYVLYYTREDGKVNDELNIKSRKLVSGISDIQSLFLNKGYEIIRLDLQGR